MEKKFEIDGVETLVEKTSAKPFINGVGHIKLQVRQAILDRDDQRNGYHLTYCHVPVRATWAEIEKLVREYY